MKKGIFWVKSFGDVAEVAEVAGSGHDSWNDKQDEDFD